MTFKNRKEAGALLAGKLKEYKNRRDGIVLGLPRGGLVTAYEIAKALNLPLDVICARKVGAPFNPELAIGAVTESGARYLNTGLIARLEVSQSYIDHALENEIQEAQRRSQAFRLNLLPLDLKNKIVILVDDGMATGATMRVSIKSVKTLGALKIVMALPVVALDTLEEIKYEVDETVILQAPPSFAAVGQFYEDFSQTSDSEVVALLRQAHKTGGR